MWIVYFACCSERFEQPAIPFSLLSLPLGRLRTREGFSNRYDPQSAEYHCLANRDNPQRAEYPCLVNRDNSQCAEYYCLVLLSDKTSIQ